MHAESYTRWSRILTILIPIFAFTGCGEGDGPTRIANSAAVPLNLPAGFCDPINFEIECELPEIINFNGGATVIVDLVDEVTDPNTEVNLPDPTNVNPSDRFARMQKFGDADFGGTRFNPLETPVDFSAGQAFKVKVWSERDVPVLFKLEESNDGSGGIPKVVSHGGGSVWEELCFDFTSGVPGNPTIGLTIIFDNGVLGAAQAGVFSGDWTFYYDDITQVESCADPDVIGILPDFKLYDPTATPVIPVDVVVTEFDSQSVIDRLYAVDDTYSPVLAVSSGVGNGPQWVAQIGFIGFDPGFVTFYETLDFKVKGMPNSVIFVGLYEGGDPLRINLSSSNFSEALDNGWYQVSIPVSSFTGLTSATGIVFESDDTATMQFTMFLTDIGFSESDDGGDCDNGGGSTSLVVFDDDYGTGVSFAPFGGSINDVTVDSTEAYSGTASLKVVVPSAEYTGGALVADPARDLSAYDTLTFWAKASDARTLNVAGISDDASGNAPNAFEVPNLALTTDWQQFTITIPDPSVLTASTGLFHFAEGSDEGVYTIWFDDIQYEGSGGGDCDDGGDDGGDGGATDPDAVVFDDDYSAGVSFAPFGGSVNDVTVDATEAYSGTAALKVEVPASDYTGGALVADPARDVSAYDTLTFWAKASDARTLNVAGIADDASGNAPNSVEVMNLALTTTWTQYTITIPDPSVLTANTGLFHFAEGSDEGAYTIWFDEITYVSSSGGGGNGGGGVAGNITINGGFETGTFNDGSENASWQQFAGGSSTQTITTDNPHSGTYAANLNIPVLGAGDPPVDNLIKNANLEAGNLTPNASVTVTFWMRGTLVGDSGVVFAELFSELDGGGTSKAEILSGGPLVPNAAWTEYSYMTTLGDDVAGGVTLQLKVGCGNVEGCGADVYFDDVSIVIE